MSLSTLWGRRQPASARFRKPQPTSRSRRRLSTLSNSIRRSESRKAAKISAMPFTAGPNNAGRISSNSSYSAHACSRSCCGSPVGGRMSRSSPDSTRVGRHRSQNRRIAYCRRSAPGRYSRGAHRRPMEGSGTIATTPQYLANPNQIAKLRIRTFAFVRRRFSSAAVGTLSLSSPTIPEARRSGPARPPTNRLRSVS
jgi:hypothetical protein